MEEERRVIREKRVAKLEALETEKEERRKKVVEKEEHERDERAKHARKKEARREKERAKKALEKEAKDKAARESYEQGVQAGELQAQDRRRAAVLAVLYWVLGLCAVLLTLAVTLVLLYLFFRRCYPAFF